MSWLESLGLTSMVAKASVKTVTAASAETKSEEEGAVTKSQVQEGWEDQCSILPDKGSLHKVGSGCGWEFPNQGISESNFFAEGIY